MATGAVRHRMWVALNWRYQLDLALPDGEVVRVSFDDCIHLGDVILYIE